LPIHIDDDYVIRTLTDLVRIDSINPMLVPGAPGEAAAARYIAGELTAAGLETTTCELGPGRANVVGIRKGMGAGRALMFNGHTDTVGVDGMQEPFAATVRDGRLYGRGACDMKGGLAAMLAAVKALADSGARLEGDVILAAVADEEYGSIGTEALLQRHRPAAAIVAEPTDLDICIAHKGFCVFEIETRGRAAHGARYMDGIDANLHMGRVLAELDRHARQLLERDPHPLLGPPSLLVPLVAGGSHQFVYADTCRASVERRTLPGETADQVAGGLEAILERCSAGDPTFRASVKAVMSRDAYEIPRDREIVRVVADSAERVLGRRPAFIGHHWWEDAALIAASGAETVIIGPKGGGLHTHEEWVEIASVVDLARVLAECALTYCA